MPIQIFDSVLNQSLEYLSAEEVINLCELSQEEAIELRDYGALSSDMVVDEKLFFSAQRMQFLKHACAQRRDYDLDLFSVVLVLGYLQEIASLKQQLAQYEARAQSPG